MNSPKISVIIPNYNYAKYLTVAIDSVLNQTFPNVEIIVVDDGSKDNSLEILSRYDEKIRVLTQKNQGVSRARNSGAAVATGEYIAFLDADDIWLPEKLERQMEKFRSNDEIGLVHCSMAYIDENDKPCGENRAGKEGWLAKDLLLLKEGAVIGAGSTALVKKKHFDELGGFDPRLSTSADWEFCYRIAVKCQIGFVAEPLVLYRFHNSNMHNNVGAMEHDVSIGLEKAFADSSKEIETIRNKCYGNFHFMLAGSYFKAKNYPAFVKHAVKSLFYRPRNIAHFLALPLRKMKSS